MVIDTKERQKKILDAASKLIIQYGFDKTTMGDVADAVGINRALIYPLFKSKDDLLEALIRREMWKYSELWIANILADPKGGTVASIHRSISYAMKCTPFMTAIVTRDEATFGKYLRKTGNIFSNMQGLTMTTNLLQALQDAGTVRQGVNIPAMAYLMDMISFALVEKKLVPTQSKVPTFDELVDTMAEMYDRMLTPKDGTNYEAGKNVLRLLADYAKKNLNNEIPEEER